MCSLYSFSDSDNGSGHSWFGVTPNISCNMKKVPSHYSVTEPDCVFLHIYMRNENLLETFLLHKQILISDSLLLVNDP